MASRTKRTAKKDGQFFAAIGKGHPVGKACEVAGYGRSTAYEYRDEDEGFAKRWKEANEEAVEVLEAEADRRAIQGTLKPVFHRGVQCGSIREFSDVLLIFRLKALRPEVYRERADLRHSGSIETSGVLVVPGMASAEEWDKLQQQRREAGEGNEEGSTGAG